MMFKLIAICMWYCSSTRAVEIPNLTADECAAIKVDMQAKVKEAEKKSIQAPVFSIHCMPQRR